MYAYDESYVVFDERDDKGRSVRYLDIDGWGYERIFDDEWDMQIPAEVIETTHGKITYERHYDTVTIDSRIGIGCRGNLAVFSFFFRFKNTFLYEKND